MIRDEYLGTQEKDDPPAIELRLASERVSPREIIRQRVFSEVAEINESRLARSKERYKTRSLLIEVEPNSVEDKLNALNPWSSRGSTTLDAEKEFQKALKAFTGNRFIMLFDDNQVDGLEDDLTLTDGSEVTFLHLTPLKGG